MKTKVKSYAYLFSNANGAGRTKVGISAHGTCTLGALLGSKFTPFENGDDRKLLFYCSHGNTLGDVGVSTFLSGNIRSHVKETITGGQQCTKGS